jgi:hypothetical protein
MAEQTVEDYLKTQEAEWTTYVATEVININGARAFNPGDPVPASHVEGGVVPSGSVAKAQRDEPAGNASLEAWQEFARSKGATDEDLADKSRDQLRDLYTTKES